MALERSRAKNPAGVSVRVPAGLFNKITVDRNYLNYLAPAELRRPLREPPERPPDDPPRPLLLLDDDDRLRPALPRPELMLLPPLPLRVVDLPRPPDLPPPPLELPRFAAMTSPN